MLLSFVIPVYNGEETIRRCLDSIYAADEHTADYEVIVVDDGSTDNTFHIVSECTGLHKNMKVMQQRRGGVSVARNKGLDLASGDFIWFVDADDMVLRLDKPVTQIIKEHPTAGVIAFNYNVLRNGAYFPNDSFGQVGVVDGVSLLRQFRLYLWDKVFSREAIGAYRFMDGTVNQEDMLFCIEVLSGVKNVVCMPERAYLYDCSGASSTTRSKAKRQYVKNYHDSVAVQSRIKDMVGSMRNVEAKSVVQNILHVCVINHFYVIFRYYGYNRVRRAISDYSSMGLYPLGLCSDRRKNLFAMIANTKRLFLACAWIRWKVIKRENV